MPRRAVAAAAAAAAAVVMASCSAPPSPSVAAPTPAPVLSLSDIDAEPIERQEESVALAFDRQAAAELLQSVPADLDFDEHAVVCVFLGPRPTTGWSLDLRTASLTGGELRIRARETAPRAGTRDEVTYPADCGLLTRGALPVGEVLVRADDTITDEFIADTTVIVPEPSAAP